VSITTAMYSDNTERRNYSRLWTHRGNKFVLGTIHGEKIEIVAQYNPKELSRQVQAEWNDNPNTSAKQSKTSESKVWAEYGTSRPRSVTLELLFDGYEENLSVAPIVEDLERLALPVDMRSSDPTKRRPQLCVAVWGAQQLRCVVESVATKLTMFDISGEPLRATCTVQLKEVDVVAMLESEASSATQQLRGRSGGYTYAPRQNIPYPPEDSKPTRVPNPAAASDISAAAGNPEDPNKQSAKTNMQPQSADARTSATRAKATEPTPKSPAQNDRASAPTPAADAPIVTNPTVTTSAPAASPAPAPIETRPATGVPSANVNPAALDGAEPGNGDVFENDQASPPVAAPSPAAPATGVPSAKVNPAALDGAEPGQGDVFENDRAPAPDATSSADAAKPEDERMRVYKDLE